MQLAIERHRSANLTKLCYLLLIIMFARSMSILGNISSGGGGWVLLLVALMLVATTIWLVSRSAR
jgi:hypothetical protein